MWKILEIGEKIEARDERYFPKDFAWTSVNESMVGSPVVRIDHVVRRKISEQVEGQKPTTNTESPKLLCPNCHSEDVVHFLKSSDCECVKCNCIWKK